LSPFPGPIHPINGLGDAVGGVVSTAMGQCSIPHVLDLATDPTLSE